MKANTNTKANNRKKLIPAAGALMISAAMLGTSTFAWFTMSREVEVSNIQMSATVPEDIQISLGTIAKADRSAISPDEKTASLANGKGVLWGGANTAADNGAVVAPTNEWDWANIVDISEYYRFGKLIPASSTDGLNIFFTPEAAGNGTIIQKGADFYRATDATNNLNAAVESSTGRTGAAATDKLSATAHAVTTKSNAVVSDNWAKSGGGYTGSSNWNDTKDDGYYVDIPVWLRTSQAGGAKLSVQAYVKPQNSNQKLTTDNNKTDGEALYRAVRVAILDCGDVGGTGANAPKTTATDTTTGLLPIADGWKFTSVDENTTGTLKENPFTLGNDGITLTDSILNWYGRDTTTGASTTELNYTTGSTNGNFAAVSALGTGADAKKPTYSNVSVYTPLYDATNADKNVAVTLSAKASDSTATSNYGPAHKIIVRVWLEGEDPDCWNETSGQDWSINLKFNNENFSQTSTTATDDLKNVNKEKVTYTEYGAANNP